ncbi:MAG: glutamine--tRNA ligase/YqeY domain fusion protein [Bdellovibrionales bacterium]|nr:glutamine--tRNA ligase/YqeY domain fusion protein [Bdellovibrionales bacterium]
MTSGENESVGVHFIKRAIDADLESGKNDGRVHTRFPPEPNGYLHIGHAKAICLNFGLAREYNGACNLRLDDTNPIKEDTEYVEAIQRDIRWLGFDWGENLFYASDYFGRLFDLAVVLIERGHAYVDSQTADEIRANRGTLTAPGRESPFRERSIEENRELFLRMRAGEFSDGEHVLRAKIDMAHPNMNMRDPALYRIRHVHHHRTGDAWPIYPMYDYAHGLSDAFEGITHSLCSLEFEDHRPLYDWFLDVLQDKLEYRPVQMEFARLNLTHTVMSKRKLLSLVQGKHVSGWDDPRMPTLSGLRRRGYPPEAIRDFCERIGISKANSVVDFTMLEHCVREYLNQVATRVMAVLDPLRVVITNYPEGNEEQLEAENNPEDAGAGSRTVPFCREVFIDRSDFEENPPKKWFRLAPGQEVRLKHAYYIRCEEVIKDASGKIVELRCSYDPKTRGGWSDDGRKVKGTLQWVSARHGVSAEVRHFNHLFLQEDPEAVEQGSDFLSTLNPGSLEKITTCVVEPFLKEACAKGDSSVTQYFQFLRQGYYVPDSVDCSEQGLVFNQVVGLKDSYAAARGQGR